MAEVEPMRVDKDLDKVATDREKQKPSHSKHGDTGEHAKKNETERAHVADEGLGMSKDDSARRG